MKKSKNQRSGRRQPGSGRGLKQAITVAAAVASLGVSLGVDVEKGFAADNVGTVQPSALQKGDAAQYKEQGPSVQHKIESDMHKGELPAVQHKMESDMHKTDGSSTQLKYERKAAEFLKFDGKKLRNGDTFVIQDGKPFIRRQNGQMVPAAGKIYLFQDGTKLQMGK